MKLKKIAALLAVAGISAPAFATNGMNMEGYGPVATGMGGASMAYDNGTAGMINNPATLGFMKSGTSRLDVAIGGLHPDVSANTAGATQASSGGTSYYMPAIGYVRKDGKLTWGAGMMSQGGMGTEYGKTSFLSGFASAFANTRGASGQEVRSELGLGRFLIPVAYDVTDSLKVGGSFDYVWGGLDLQMILPGNQFARMLNGDHPGARFTPGAQSNMANLALLGPSFGGAGIGGDINYGYFNFSEGTNKFSQAATTNGFAGNLGFAFQATPALSIGGVYHARTALSDMSGNGSMVIGGATGNAILNGKFKVINFQWPETYGIGFAYKASDKLTIAADYKSIGWSNTMKYFRFSFQASGGGNAAGTAWLAGGANNVDIQLSQMWKDQSVVQLGVSYMVDDQMTLRFGANISNNPIPNNFVNPLFPATTENHVTFGLGYAMSKSSGVDFSLSHAPKVTVTNPGGSFAAAPAFGLGALPATAVPATGISHSQTNWQLMYNQRF